MGEKWKQKRQGLDMLNDYLLTTLQNEFPLYLEEDVVRRVRTWQWLGSILQNTHIAVELYGLYLGLLVDGCNGKTMTLLVCSAVQFQPGEE